MNTFDIRIQHQRLAEGGGDKCPVVIEHSRPDSQLPVRVEGRFHFDENTRQRLTELALDPKQYGQVLGKALFARDVGEAFAEARGVSQAQDGSEALLRILLSVEAPVLKSLHWERLAAPLPNRRWGILARNQNIPFSIHLASTTGQPYPAIGWHDLRALVLVANPGNLAEYSLARFDDEAAVQNMRTAIGEAMGDGKCDILAAVDGADATPTLDNLLEYLSATHYPILHVTAHAQYSESRGDTRIYPADEDNQVDALSASRLVELLQDIPILPRFAFLVACESGAPEAEAQGGMGGTGPAGRPNRYGWAGQLERG